jgi:hypothetical protein
MRSAVRHTSTANRTSARCGRAGQAPRGACAPTGPAGSARGRSTSPRFPSSLSWATPTKPRGEPDGPHTSGRKARASCAGEENDDGLFRPRRVEAQRTNGPRRQPQAVQIPHRFPSRRGTFRWNTINLVDHALMVKAAPDVEFPFMANKCRPLYPKPSKPKTVRVAPHKRAAPRRPSR